MTTYNTGNPIGSTDARDLYDNAQALDEAVNSTGSTFTDRRGVVRKTLVGLHQEFPNASANATASAGSASAAAASASSAAASEAVATTQANTATTQAGLAATAKTAAEAARDAALIQAGVYVDEPTGRAAVANGVAFKVQGSGDVAAYEYRRVSSSSSTLIATYPSKAAYDSIKAIVGNGPKTGTFSSTLTFDDDEVVDSYLQTGAITFTLAASGHKIGVSKRITVIGNGSGIAFGFAVGVQQGAIVSNKVNTIYMVYVGNSTVDLHIVNSDTALSDTTNLLALVQADSTSKLTLSGSNVTAMIDQSPQASNFAVVGTMPYDSTNKFITPTGARFSFTTRSPNSGNFTLVLAARFNSSAEQTLFLGNALGNAAESANTANGWVDNLFNRGQFQSYTDAMTKITGDSVIVIVGTANLFRAYVNNVLVAEKTTGGPYSGVSAIKSLLTNAENYTISAATRFYEFRVINKAYTDDSLLTQLYEDIKTRYSLDPTIYPTLSSLTYTGTPVLNGTITAAWTYNQNAAGPIGRYRIEWRWDSNPSAYWFYMYTPGGKIAFNDPVSPALFSSGKYWKYRVTVQDDQGRCSKVAYESPAIYVP